MRIDIEIPDEASAGRYGVYVLTNQSGDYLYIGHSKNLLTRLRQHRHDRPWWHEVRSLEWVPCQGYNEARATEKNLIAAFSPVYNLADVLDLPSPKPRARNPYLPDWTVARLVEMREAEADDRNARDDLDSYILSLRQAKWSLEAIGRGLGMTRERVRQRQARAVRPLKGANVPQIPVKVKPAPVVKPTIPPDVLAEMRELQKVARTVNGPTPLDHPSREASVRYTEMLAEQHLAGVSIYRISRQLGVTHLAIRARLSRHGYMEPVKGLPANTAYGTPWRGPGPRPPRTHCKRGHSMTDESNVLRTTGKNPQRLCRECNRIRSNEYYQRKKASA